LYFDFLFLGIFMSDVFFPLYGGLSMLIRESDMKNICQPDKLAALAGCVSVPMMKDCMPAADISDHFDSESGKEIFIFR